MSRDQLRRELFEHLAAHSDDAEAMKASSVFADELGAIWRAAQAEARAAYAHWCELPGREAYAVYRVAQDRADEAQDALWQQHIITEPYGQEALRS